MEAQLRPETDDQSNLMGQLLKAQSLIAASDLVTLIKWRDGANVEHQLTAPQMVDFAFKAGEWKTLVYERYWAVKALNPIPADYADDVRWP